MEQQNLKRNKQTNISLAAFFISNSIFWFGTQQDHTCCVPNQIVVFINLFCSPASQCNQECQRETINYTCFYFKLRNHTKWHRGLEKCNSRLHRGTTYSLGREACRIIGWITRNVGFIDFNQVSLWCLSYALIYW